MGERRIGRPCDRAVVVDGAAAVDLVDEVLQAVLDGGLRFSEALLDVVATRVDVRFDGRVRGRLALVAAMLLRVSEGKAVGDVVEVAGRIRHAQVLVKVRTQPVDVLLDRVAGDVAVIADQMAAEPHIVMDMGVQVVDVAFDVVAGDAVACELTVLAVDDVAHLLHGDAEELRDVVDVRCVEIAADAVLDVHAPRIAGAGRVEHLAGPFVGVHELVVLERRHEPLRVLRVRHGGIVPRALGGLLQEEVRHAGADDLVHIGLAVVVGVPDVRDGRSGPLPFGTVRAFDAEGDGERLRVGVRAQVVLVHDLAAVDVLAHPVGAVGVGGGIVLQAFEVRLAIGVLLDLDKVTVAAKTATGTRDQRKLVIAFRRRSIGERRPRIEVGIDNHLACLSNTPTGGPSIRQGRRCPIVSPASCRAARSSDCGAGARPHPRTR